MSFDRTFTHDLSDEPESALVQLYERSREWMKTSDSGNSRAEYLFIVKFIHKYAERYNLDIDLPSLDDIDEHGFLERIIQELSHFKRKIESSIVDSQVEEAISRLEDENRSSSFGIARLSQEDRKQIHVHLNNLRTIIDGAEITERKRNAPLKRLNALVEEVDLEGTKTDRFFEFAGDLAFVAGDMAKKAKPLIDEFKDVLRIVYRARARTEGVELPKPPDPLSLPFGS